MGIVTLETKPILSNDILIIFKNKYAFYHPINFVSSFEILSTNIVHARVPVISRINMNNFLYSYNIFANNDK